MREDIGNFLCRVLDLLDMTGKQERNPIAAHFGKHDDRVVELDICGNG